MIELLDANCRIGTGPADEPGAPVSAAALTALMDRFGVSAALVYHTASEFSDPALGNRLLTEETGESPRFLWQWAVLPAVWGGFTAETELPGEMKRAGVRSVRLFPKRYGHSLLPYAAGKLMAALAAHRVPAFIPLTELTDWDALYRLCRDFPENRFVLCSPGYRCLRFLVPIMEACPNLYAETSNFLVHNGIPAFCREMGDERLLFGSGAPEASLAAAASQLLLSDIPETSKRRIGAENLRRLLSEVTL